MALIDFSNEESDHIQKKWAKHWYKMYQEREFPFIYHRSPLPLHERKFNTKRWFGYLIHSLVLSLSDFLREKCVWKLDRLSSKIIYRFDL